MARTRSLKIGSRVRVVGDFVVPVEGVIVSKAEANGVVSPNMIVIKEDDGTIRVAPKSKVINVE